MGKLKESSVGCDTTDLKGPARVARGGRDFLGAEVDAVPLDQKSRPLRSLDGLHALEDDRGELGGGVGLESDGARPGVLGSQARQVPVDQVESVGDANQDQPRALHGGELEERVEDLLLTRHELVELIKHHHAHTWDEGDR